MDNLLQERGTPKYRNGKLPKGKVVRSPIVVQMCGSTAAVYTADLEALAYRPEALEKERIHR